MLNSKSKTRRISKSTSKARSPKAPKPKSLAKKQSPLKPKVVRLKAEVRTVALAPKQQEKPSRNFESIAPIPDATKIAEALSVGYTPATPMSADDETLFRAFQSNLLSLISHELRTPLTGVLNALNALDPESEAQLEGISQRELINMARKNAQRLHQTLVTLLDLAAVESGSFHARLREVELLRLVRTRFDTLSHVGTFADASLDVQIHSKLPDGDKRSESYVLADAQKLGRALDLCYQVIAARAEPSSTVNVMVDDKSVQFHFQLPASGEAAWKSAWLQALAGFEGGVGSPTSAFGGVVQSERAFLTRSEEGLGSELILIHQIIQLHHGKLTGQTDGRAVAIGFELPALSGEEGLRAVLKSRAYEVSHELGSVALVMVGIPEGPEGKNPAAFQKRLTASLFRATDAAYPVPERKAIALVLDDCKLEDALRVIKRLEKSIGHSLKFGIGHCPADGLDPAALVDLAEQRLQSST